MEKEEVNLGKISMPFERCASFAFSGETKDEDVLNYISTKNGIVEIEQAETGMVFRLKDSNGKIVIECPVLPSMLEQLESSSKEELNCTVLGVWSMKKLENLTKEKLMLADIASLKLFAFDVFRYTGKNNLHVLDISKTEKGKDKETFYVLVKDSKNAITISRLKKNSPKAISADDKKNLEKFLKENLSNKMSKEQKEIAESYLKENRAKKDAFSEEMYLLKHPRTGEFLVLDKTGVSEIIKDFPNREIEVVAINVVGKNVNSNENLKTLPTQRGARPPQFERPR